MRAVLLLEVRRSGEGTLEVRAPSLGWWSEAPAEGEIVGPGSRAGVLQRLGRRWTLVLPGDLPPSRVRCVEAHRRRRAIGYAEVLFRLEALEASAGSTAARGPETTTLPGLQGSLVVRAPSDGVFYRRPTPQAPPFIEPGRRVRAGQPVGLIEVMKTFHQVLYGGEGWPQEAEVVSVAAEDAQEVHAGDPLVVLRPVG